MTVSREPGRPGEPQPVLGPPSEAAIFLVVTVDPGAEPVARDLLADLAGLRRFRAGTHLEAGRVRFDDGTAAVVPLADLERFA